MGGSDAPERTGYADRPGPDMVPSADSVAASIRAGPGRLGDAQRRTVAEEALELAQWLGTGQALLARLQESFGNLSLLNELGEGTHGQRHKRSRMVGQLIREAVEHFGRMP